jgi:hypothetical protein
MNIYRKGIIREIPMDCTLPYIKKELKRTNPDLNIIDVTKDEKKGEKGWDNYIGGHFSICITVRNKELPNCVYIWRARLGLEAYIPAIQQCYKCGSPGHLSKS